MLGIFGFYNFKNNAQPVTDRLCELFSVQNISNESVIFSQDGISLVYETFKVKEAGNFYCIDKSRRIACFIVGNIYADEESSLKVLTGQDIAKLVVDKYASGDLEGFVKSLRGVFNIVLIDKSSVLLINDILGLSPLYIYRINTGVLFCNEPEAMMRFKGNNRIDYGALAEFLVYGFVPDGKTFVEGLCNQEPGTIIKISNRKVTCKKYVIFKVKDISGLSDYRKIQSVRDVFREAVQIRIPTNVDKVISDLSGGWDTRYILANLCALKKKVTAFTSSGNAEDLDIARQIVKQKRLDHSVLDLSALLGFSPNQFLDLNYKKRQIADFMPGNNLSDLSILTSPRFTGLFGGELLGNTPAWFDERIRLNFLIHGYKLLSRDFFNKAVENKKEKDIKHFSTGLMCPVYTFLNQIGRSYLNTHYASSWERPTTFFGYTALMPFTDSKFVSLLCGLEYGKYMRYRLYETLYRKYFPDYLHFPWTYTPLRRRNDLNKAASRPSSVGIMNKRICAEKQFVAFLKKETFFKDKSWALKRLKELYFLAFWFTIYRPVLNFSDVPVFVRDLLGSKKEEWSHER